MWGGGQSQTTWFLTRPVGADGAAKARQLAQHRRSLPETDICTSASGKEEFKARGFPLEDQSSVELLRLLA